MRAPRWVVLVFGALLTMVVAGGCADFLMRGVRTGVTDGLSDYFMGMVEDTMAGSG